MKSPILFIIFKRSDTTLKVFERIREARPTKLYVAADGPRPNHPQEKYQCEITRKIIDNVDWPCQVYRLFQDRNLGCGRGVMAALSWFFSKEEEGIILEDDIFPHIDFFSYCDEMLEKYRNDTSIQMVCGHNVFYNGIEHTSSYYKSSFIQIWGWASWRRVWDTYEFDTNKLDKDLLVKKLLDRIPKKGVTFFKDAFNFMKSYSVDTWDYQLFFNQILYDRYSLISYVNQTENIGFGSMDSAHTTGENSVEAIYKALSAYPIIHPNILSIDENGDYINMINSHQYIRDFKHLIIIRVRRVVKSLLKKLKLLDIVYTLK